MDTSNQEVPNSLRNWLVFHFYVDYAFAIPFFFFPETTAEILGYDPLDPLAARIVAAALFGIGYSSYLASKFDLKAMHTKLRWAVVWAGSATIGLLWAANTVEHIWGWVFAGIFLFFFMLWGNYALRLGSFK